MFLIFADLRINIFLKLFLINSNGEAFSSLENIFNKVFAINVSLHQRFQIHDFLESENKTTERIAIHLFRKALRLHDNQGLQEAIQTSCKLLPLYIFNDKHLDPELAGVNQLDFLLQSLKCLNDQLVEKGGS